MQSQQTLKKFETFEEIIATPDIYEEYSNDSFVNQKEFEFTNSPILNDQNHKEFEFSNPKPILNENKTNPNLDEEISFSCRQCYKSFEEPRFLILHISTEHNNDCNAKSTKNQDRNQKSQKNQKKKINQKNQEQQETNQKSPISEMPTIKTAFVAKSLCNFEKNSALEKVIFCQEILEKHSYKVDNSKNFPDLNLNLNLPLTFTISKSKSKKPNSNANLNPKTVSSHVHKKNKHKHKKFGSKALLEKHSTHSTTSKRSKPSKTSNKYEKKNFKGIEFQVLDEIE